MTKLNAGPVIKRKKNPSKKVLISIIAPAGIDISGTKVSTVENDDGSQSWDFEVVDTQSSFIIIRLNGKIVTLLSESSAKGSKSRAPVAAGTPDPGTLTITLTDTPTGVSSVITDVPVVFVDDINP